MSDLKKELRVINGVGGTETWLNNDVGSTTAD